MVTSLKKGAAVLLLTMLAPIVTSSSTSAGVNTPTSTPPEVCSDVEHVLLLVDQSLSLEDTDPEVRRRTAGYALIDVFASSAIPVDLTIAGFGNKVTPFGRFRLGTASYEVDDARAALDRVVSSATDRNTDYVAALTYAVEFFAGTDGDDLACRSMVWFTDGAYDIERTTPSDQYDVSKYTTETDDKQIEDQFEAQVCGDPSGKLPEGSLLASPLSTQIRASNFSISFIDLQTGVKSELRQQTEAVINRLLRDDDDPCRVDGRWTTVNATAGLLSDFFVEGQRALGRTELKDCGVLGIGLPISALKSVAVLAEEPNSTVRIVGPTGVIASGVQATYAVLNAEQRRSSGLVSAEVSEGAVAYCFVESEIDVSLASRPTIYSEATTATVALRVTGGGLSSRAEGALSDDLVDIEIAVDGRQIPPERVRFDPESREFRITLEGPFNQDEVSLEATATFTATGTRERTPLSETLKVVLLPPTPRAIWVGATELEGAGTIDGEIVVESDISGPGQMCVMLSSGEPITADDGTQIGLLTIESTGKVCQPLDQPIRVTASAEFPDSVNAFGSVNIDYSATFITATGDERTLDDGSLPIQFSEVKPANPAAGILFAAVIAVLVALLSYLLLFTFARQQNKLSTPSDWLVAYATVRSQERVGAAGNLDFVGEGHFQVSELVGATGTKRRYTVEPFVVQSIWPLNPLAKMRARARVDQGVVVAYPSRGRHSVVSDQVFVPVRFRRLSLIRVIGDQITMRILMSRGSTASDFEAAMREALAKSHSALLSAMNRGDAPGSGGEPRTTGPTPGPTGDHPRPPTPSDQPFRPPAPPPPRPAPTGLVLRPPPSPPKGR